MDPAAIREFIDLFQDFLDRSDSKNWPKETTSKNEIRDAYLVAEHIGKCVIRFIQQGLLEEFLDAIIKDNQIRSKPFVRQCLIHPPRIILKKIINSKTSIKQVEVAVQLYLEMYSEEMLQTSLMDLFVETASRETLIKNLSTELTEGQLVLFQTTVFLSELNNCNEPEEFVRELLKGASQECFEIVLVGLLNEEPKYKTAVHSIEVVVEQIMLRRQVSDKKFWDHFFLMRDEYFITIMCKYPNLFNHVCTALFDLGKLIKNKMSMKFFYIQMSRKDFKYVVYNLCELEETKYKFIDAALERSGDPDYWTKLIQEIDSEMDELDDIIY